MLAEKSPTYDRSCIDCVTRACELKNDAYPAVCATKVLSNETRKELETQFGDPTVKRIAEAVVETNNRSEQMHWCRIEEVMDFARRMKMQKLGIAMCTALLTEARALARVLRANNFEVFGIACKAGALTNEDLHISETGASAEIVSCDPLYQAHLLNSAKTDLNLVVGLCVGHDMLFISHSDAPTTTVVVRDFVTVHNPVIPLYTLDGVSRFNRMIDGSSPYGFDEDETPLS